MISSQYIDFKESRIFISYCDSSNLYCLLKRNKSQGSGGKSIIFSHTLNILSIKTLPPNCKNSSSFYLNKYLNNNNNNNNNNDLL